jgi:hypothetical protein
MFVSRQYEQLAQQKEKSRLINQEGASQESLRYLHGPPRHRYLLGSFGRIHFDQQLSEKFLLGL